MNIGIALSKKGINALNPSNVPKNFIFNSQFNTLKIIKHKVIDFSLSSSGGVQEFTTPHGLSFIPFIIGFAQFKSLSTGDTAMLPNQQWVDVVQNSFFFNSLLTDKNNIIVRVTNNSGVVGTITVSYFLFEVPF